MHRSHEYARIERERRFLLDRFPNADVVRVRHITDRYIDGARLRLREQTDDGGRAIFKLTQKLPARANGAQQRLITNIYLTRDEFRFLAQLPGKTLRKVRYSVPLFGVDVFEGSLQGLKQSSTPQLKPMPSSFLISFFTRSLTTSDSREGSLSARRGRLSKPGCENME